MCVCVCVCARARARVCTCEHLCMSKCLYMHMSARSQVSQGKAEDISEPPIGCPLLERTALERGPCVCVCVCVCVYRSALSRSLVSNSETPWKPSRLLRPWDFPNKNTGMGCHFLFQRVLQGIFLTQGLNPHLLHWQADSLLQSHREVPITAQQG